MIKFKTLKEEYIEFISNKISISKDDLTETELLIINEGFDIFKEKLEDIKILNDEIKRISIELANIKSYMDDSENSYDNESEDFDLG